MPEAISEAVIYSCNNMITIFKPEDCCGCTACYAVCPVKCISMSEDAEGFSYPAVDQARCTKCGACDRVCPVLNRRSGVKEPHVYACRGRDLPVRMMSSSGGVFSLLAEKVIERGGVVFGAAFTDGNRLVHTKAETRDGLDPLRRSKYLQSDMGDTFADVKRALKEGREVLFSGVPCQISGLGLYLGRDYPNLLKMDIACHGVPSPKVFGHYLRSYFGEEVSDINFRDKRTGWNRYSFALKYIKDGKAEEFSQPFIVNPFMRGFLRRLYSRPVCHACPCKALSSGSDITLGDFWGVAGYYPDMDDNKGVSVAFVNSARGVECFGQISDSIESIRATYAEGVACNQSIVKSTKVSPKRAKFFATFGERDFSELVFELTRTPKYVKVIKRLKQYAAGLRKKR